MGLLWGGSKVVSFRTWMCPTLEGTELGKKEGKLQMAAQGPNMAGKGVCLDHLRYCDLRLKIYRNSEI